MIPAASFSSRGTRRRSGARKLVSQSRQRYSRKRVRNIRIRSKPLFCLIIR